MGSEMCIRDRKMSCPTRPTVTRNHKLHGRHKSPTNLEVEQYNNIRGGDIPKERGMQRRPRVQVRALVVKQPSSSHLVQPIAWRCPDLGLTPKNDVCRTGAGTMRLDSWKRFPCRDLSTVATKLWTSKAGFNRPSFGKMFVDFFLEKNTQHRDFLKFFNL